MTPTEMARPLGATPPALRSWLRRQRAAGHPLLKGHHHDERWIVSRADAERLMMEFGEQRRDRRSSEPAGRFPVAQPAEPIARHPCHATPPTKRSEEPGHRVVLEWMGHDVETLADLLRPGLRAVVVGINPAPKSVAVGHYYQGALGKRFFSRLERAGLLPAGGGFEDDRAFAAGIGFTDVVKRPTPSAKEVSADEFEHGRAILEAKLAALAVPLIIFTFKGAATPLLGNVKGHGSLGRRRLAGARIFVMPGPMERRERVDLALADLRRLARASRS